MKKTEPWEQHKNLEIVVTMAVYRLHKGPVNLIPDSRSAPFKLAITFFLISLLGPLYSYTLVSIQYKSNFSCLPSIDNGSIGQVTWQNIERFDFDEYIVFLVYLIFFANQHVDLKYNKRLSKHISHEVIYLFTTPIMFNHRTIWLLTTVNMYLAPLSNLP